MLVVRGSRNSVPAKGNGKMREIESVTLSVGYHLVHAKILSFFSGDRRLERRNLNGLGGEERLDEQLDVGRSDHRLITLDVHKNVGTSPHGHLLNAVGSGSMFA